VDYIVTEVSEETVLTDATGLHLGGGPYMLIYSRAMSKIPDVKAIWPSRIKDKCKGDNLDFIQTLDTEFAARLRENYKRSPPSSPVTVVKEHPKDCAMSEDIIQTGTTQSRTEGHEQADAMDVSPN